jgi:dephospho-CoA kinase
VPVKGSVYRPGVILVALTGGIGSGKSSVAAGLITRGAIVVDSDETVKRLQAPGGAVLAAMVARWGERILDEDGSLRRQAVADIVFSDADELKALNKIVHPAVNADMARQIVDAAPLGRVVVNDIPLLAEGKGVKRPQFSAVVVVDLPPEVAVERLVQYRGFSEADAWNRINAQASREDRLAIATYVVDNSGTPEHLDAEIDKLWAYLQTAPDVPIPREFVKPSPPPVPPAAVCEG